MSDFVKERDKAFIDFVRTGNIKKVKAYSKKYGVPMPEDKKILAAGIYKAVQYCMRILDNVKNLAFQKCIEIGFVPFIDFDRDKNAEDRDAE